MALIINADDFGKTKDVNNAITESFNKGFINRTTVMVNMPYAASALELALKNGFSDKVGLHLNLTEGEPLTDGIKNNPFFCDENGKYNAFFYHSTKLRLHMDSKSVKDIEKELRAQIDMYHDLGFTLDHIDSHHHAHTNWPVLQALTNLALIYDFTSIRISRNLYKGGSKLNRIYKSLYNNQVKKICDNVTDYFGSYKDVCQYFKDENTVNDSSDNYNSVESYDSASFLDFTKKYDVEIMVHPGYDESGNLVDIGTGPMNIHI